MNTIRPPILLTLALAACALVSSCAPLTAEQQAKITYTEKLAAGVGDKILKVGVLTGYITPEEATAARAIGKIIVAPAPEPVTAPLTAPKNPVPVTIGAPLTLRFPCDALSERMKPPLFG